MSNIVDIFYFSVSGLSGKPGWISQLFLLKGKSLFWHNLCLFDGYHACEAAKAREFTGIQLEIKSDENHEYFLCMV